MGSASSGKAGVAPDAGAYQRHTPPSSLSSLAGFRGEDWPRPHPVQWPPSPPPPKSSTGFAAWRRSHKRTRQSSPPVAMRCWRAGSNESARQRIAWARESASRACSRAYPIPTLTCPPSRPRCCRCAGPTLRPQSRRAARLRGFHCLTPCKWPHHTSRRLRQTQPRRWLHCGRRRPSSQAHQIQARRAPRAPSRPFARARHAGAARRRPSSRERHYKPSQ